MTASSFKALYQPVLPLVASALNRQFAHNPQLSGIAAPMSGKCIQINITGLPIRLSLCFYGLHVEILSDDNIHADASISASAWGYWQLVNHHSADLNITGDADLAARLQRLLAELEWDFWQEVAVFLPKSSHLLAFLEKVSRHQAGNLRQAAQRFKNTSADFIANHPDVAPSYLVGDFINAVDKLRADVERLGAKFNQR